MADQIPPIAPLLNALRAEAARADAGMQARLARGDEHLAAQHRARARLLRDAVTALRAQRHALRVLLGELRLAVYTWRHDATVLRHWSQAPYAIIIEALADDLEVRMACRAPETH